MDEKQFWAVVEQAWQNAGGHSESRKKIAQGKLSQEDADKLVHYSWTEFVPALQAILEQFSKEDLMQFDRILERKLYDFDRAEVQEHTDGSDDGFLYCRGFIVAAGEEYYNAVNSNPSCAMMDLECEDVCYLPVRIYSEKFGDMPDSGISRETCSNKSSWSDSDD